MDTLNIFLKNPTKEFHVRELSRILKKSPTTISNKLKELEKKDLLDSNKKYGHLLFSLREGKKTKRLRKNYNIEKLENSGLIEFLEDYYNFPEAIVLFGSFEKGENNENSDIDLLIISAKISEPNLRSFEKKLGHKIELFVHNKKDLQKLRDKNKELFNNWINGNVIYGYFEALI